MFDLRFDEIAPMAGRTPAAVKQLAPLRHTTSWRAGLVRPEPRIGGAVVGAKRQTQKTASHRP